MGFLRNILNFVCHNMCIWLNLFCSLFNKSLNEYAISLLEFNKLCQHWKANSWPWLRSFEVDVLIYQVSSYYILKLIFI